MSTIASPRPSITLSSRRTSTSTDTTARSPSNSRPPASAASSLRRNRVALRDYYGIKNAAPADARETPPLDAEQESELDKPDFNADHYIQSLLTKEGLEGVLKVEASLVGEVRSLDGEKKALVYDNYSKLIAATDTIRSMREKMDPLTPTTSTLTPAIGHIAETAVSLSKELKKQHGASGVKDKENVKMKRAQQQTVRWVMNAPERLQQKIDQGQRLPAEEDWEEVSGLLNKWQNVKGVIQVRQACERIMDSSATE